MYIPCRNKKDARDQNNIPCIIIDITNLRMIEYKRVGGFNTLTRDNLCNCVHENNKVFIIKIAFSKM